MLSQPSEISDSRLRRKVIYNIQTNELKKFHARLPQPLIWMFQCSLSRRESLVSAYGVRLCITSKITNGKNPRKASTASYLDVSMLSQPSEIFDFRLRREVIITHPPQK